MFPFDDIIVCQFYYVLKLFLTLSVAFKSRMSKPLREVLTNDDVNHLARSLGKYLSIIPNNIFVTQRRMQLVWYDIL